jgi:hypothetical protein
MFESRGHKSVQKKFASSLSTAIYEKERLGDKVREQMTRDKVTGGQNNQGTK